MWPPVLPSASNDPLAVNVGNMLDALFTDPPRDLTPPAETPAVAFRSGGEELAGVLHIPAGPGPHPIVVILHGFPGYERNFDIAQALRRAGYATLVFHYRGSWGMGGSYSWAKVLADAATVVAAVRDPGFASRHRLDPGRVAVAGHSLGGFTALHTAAADPAVAAVVSIAPFDFGAMGVACRTDAERRNWCLAMFEECMLPLRGTSPQALLTEMETAGEAWRLADLAPRLADRPVLLVGAGRDTVSPEPFHVRPVVEAYRRHPVERLEHHVLPTDHAFSDHRIALIRLVADFLHRHFAKP